MDTARILVPMLLIALVAAPARAEKTAQPSAAHSPAAAGATHRPAAGAPRSPAAVDTAALPPSEDDPTLTTRLEKSPRHGERTSIDVDGKPVRMWVVYPERKDKAPVVVVIHEIYGLSDWIRAVADQLAAEGFIAIAPDLVSGKGPDGGGTEAFTSKDKITEAVTALNRAEVMRRLDAVRAWGLAQPSASGKSASVGFCWGGRASFAWAAAQPALDGAVVYYGPAPAREELATLRAPVLGLYGADDARVTSTVPATRMAMQDLKKSYDPHVYKGAGHAFLRVQSSGANQRAAETAWPLTLDFLRKRTR